MATLWLQRSHCSGFLTRGLAHTSRKPFATRAGIEGTGAQAVRTCDMRQARYVGSKKLRLQAFFTVTALHVWRACAWLADGTYASTSVSRCVRFVASAKAAAAASFRGIRQHYHRGVLSIGMGSIDFGNRQNPIGEKTGAVIVPMRVQKPCTRKSSASLLFSAHTTRCKEIRRALLEHG